MNLYVRTVQQPDTVNLPNGLQSHQKHPARIIKGEFHGRYAQTPMLYSPEQTLKYASALLVY